MHAFVSCRLKCGQYDIMSKAADLHTCVQNRKFCECPHGADRRHNIVSIMGAKIKHNMRDESIWHIFR